VFSPRPAFLAAKLLALGSGLADFACGRLLGPHANRQLVLDHHRVLAVLLLAIGGAAFVSVPDVVFAWGEGGGGTRWVKVRRGEARRVKVG
jgi:hypothetical protein